MGFQGSGYQASGFQQVGGFGRPGEVRMESYAGQDFGAPPMGGGGFGFVPQQQGFGGGPLQWQQQPPGGFMQGPTPYGNPGGGYVGGPPGPRYGY